MKFVGFILSALFIANTLFVSGCNRERLPSDSELFSESIQYFKEADYHHADFLLSKIQDAKIKHTKDYLMMKGFLSYQKLNYSQSSDYFRQAEPISPKMTIYIAYMHLLEGDLKAATQIIDELEITYHEDLESLSLIDVLKGNMLLKQHLYDESRSYFNKALAVERYATKPYIGIANSYFFQRHFSQAEEYYLKSVVYSEPDIQAYISLAKYYIATNRYSDAEVNLHIARQFYPNNLNLILLLSNLYLKNQSFSQALDILVENQKQLSESSIFNLQLVRCLMHLEKYEEAGKLIANLNDSKTVSSLLLSGEYYIHQKDYHFALSIFYDALSLEDVYIVNYYLGVVHLVKQDFRLASTFLNKSVRQYPGFFQSQLLLSALYLYENQFKLASEHAKVALLLEPGNINAHMIYGVTLFLQGHLQAAQYEFDIVSLLESDHPIAYIFAALIALKTKDELSFNYFFSTIPSKYLERLMLETELHTVFGKDNEATIVSYVDNHPNHLAYLILGDYYYKKQMYEVSISYYKKAVQIDDSCSACYYKISESYDKLDNTKAAILTLEASLKIGDVSRKTYRALGALFEKQKKYGRAKEIYEAGLRYSPDDPVLLNNLGWIHLVHFNDKSAFLYINKAHSISPGDPDIVDTLAWWYFLNDNIENALILLRRLIHSYPNNPLYRYHIGMVYLKNGDHKLATENLDLALKLNIDQAYVSEINTILQ